MYTEAVERMHGYTISYVEEVLKGEEFPAGVRRECKRSYTFNADAFVNRNLSPRLNLFINLDDPAGRPLLRMFDESGDWIPNPSEQRIISVIAKTRHLPESHVKRSFSQSPKYGIYPNVPDTVYNEIRKAFEGTEISVEMKHFMLYFKYPISGDDYTPQALSK